MMMKGLFQEEIGYLREGFIQQALDSVGRLDFQQGAGESAEAVGPVVSSEFRRIVVERRMGRWQMGRLD